MVEAMMVLRVVQVAEARHQYAQAFGDVIVTAESSEDGSSVVFTSKWDTAPFVGERVVVTVRSERSG